MSILFPEMPLPIAGEQCIFCGEPKEHLHHFPARSYARGGFLLPSCASCNTAISNHHPFNLQDQLAYLTDRLVQKLSFLQDEDPRSCNIPTIQRRLAWNASECFQKFEIGKTTVLPAVGKNLLEESKLLNFDLSECWFKPAKWNPKESQSAILKTELTLKKEPTALALSPAEEAMRNIARWVESEFTKTGQHIPENTLKKRLINDVLPFQMKAAITTLVEDNWLKVEYTPNGRAFCPTWREFYPSRLK